KFDIDCTFVEMNDYTEVFEALEKGEIDAGVTNKDFGNTYEKDFDIERTPIIFEPSQIQFAFPKDASLTPYLLKRIDYNIKELKENKDSIYYQSLEKWLTVKVGEKEVIPEWLNWLLIVIGGIALLLFGGNSLLRSQVKSKTKELRKEITEHKIAKDALQEAHEQLEEKVAERTKELENANLQLQKLDQLKSMFIASMSHELRTPLNSIIGFTGIILQGMSGEINEEQGKQLSLVKNSANHLLALINDVIDISKIEADKVELYIQKFDLSLLAQEIKESFAVALEKKGLALLLEKPPTLLIESDERRTKQILVNFISNALKFTYKGEIEIKIVKKDKIVEASVRDTGIGIKKEDADKLFNAFSRIPNPGRIEEGTGLGLYLSQKIARLLGGDITAESEFGKGSVFTLILPLKYKETIR
ncbi:MAG: ATP-binding protein, partial [Atribacterota bacterium]|nr:ATP-binding protein [Atribacterota bacterium]